MEKTEFRVKHQCGIFEIQRKQITDKITGILWWKKIISETNWYYIDKQGNCITSYYFIVHKLKPFRDLESAYKMIDEIIEGAKYYYPNDINYMPNSIEKRCMSLLKKNEALIKEGKEKEKLKILMRSFPTLKHRHAEVQKRIDNYNKTRSTPLNESNYREGFIEAYNWVKREFKRNNTPNN